MARKTISGRSQRSLLRSNFAAKELRKGVSPSLARSRALKRYPENLFTKTGALIKARVGSKVFSIRDLKLKGRSLAAAFNEIERSPELAREINAALKPGEKFAFSIDGTRSRQIFPDIEALIDEQFKYLSVDGPWGSPDIYHNRSKSRRLFDKIEIIRWNKSQAKWRDYTPPKKRHRKRGRK